jgi:hypothetical protein
MTNPTTPDNVSPAGDANDGTPGSGDEWAFEVRAQCSKCDRLAVVYDDYDLPLCGRHGTIFMTANKPREGIDPDEPRRSGYLS